MDKIGDLDFGPLDKFPKPTGEFWGVTANALADFVRNSKTHWVGGRDPVAVSFWVISIAMVASTVFFLMEAGRVKGHWRTSLTVGALVTLVAAVHYFYMREYWVTYFMSPIVYRYIDWSITVPLQMIEFFLILRSVGPVSSGVFWRLLVGTVVMLAFGYAGEAFLLPAWPAFILGMCGWGYILNEIFNGEASQLKAAADTPKSVQRAFNTMRSIVTIGWAIYPAGYFFGYLLGGVSDTATNGIYNIADFVNKIGLKNK